MIVPIFFGLFDVQIWIKLVWLPPSNLPQQAFPCRRRRQMKEKIDEILMRHEKLKEKKKWEVKALPALTVL